MFPAPARTAVDRVSPDRSSSGSSASGQSARFNTTTCLLASVWLVILVIPVLILVAEALDGETPVWRAVGGTVLIIVFAAVYAAAFGLLQSVPARYSRRGRFFLWFAPLGVLAVATGAVAGLPAAYLVPFLCAFLSFTLPPGRSLAPVLVIMASSSWAVYLSGDDAWVGLLGATLASPVFVYLIALASHRAGREENLSRELARTRERESLAVDVHDLLGHSLTVVTLKAELASRLVDTDPAAAKEELAQIARISRTSLAEVRATVTRLRQPDLAGEVAGAGRALETAGVAASLPTAATVAAVASGPHARLFSWVVREAVTNVVRHAGATRCTVELTADRVRVADDGTVGEGGIVEGTGLSGLRGRVEDAGGRSPSPGPRTARN